MIEITESIIKDFIKENDFEFSSTHNKLSLPVINRIYKKMKNGIKFEDIKVSSNFIIDGHHRYISSKLAEIKIGNINYPRSSATIEYSWNMVKFVNEEWDRIDKTQYLNELDAKYNDIPLKQLIEITK